MQNSLDRLAATRHMTTAKIIYHMPDHPTLLQTFVWQQLDEAPRYPRLRRFLDFWAHNIDGKLHSVEVAHSGRRAGRTRLVREMLTLH